MKNTCVEISVYGEKTYRLFLDIVKLELDRIGVSDINCIQALVLMNINENTVTMGEVLTRGYYIGSNASYNLKKMITNGYIQQTQSEYDKRASFLNLTEKGKSLYTKLNDALNKHISNFEKSLNGKEELQKGMDFLKKMEVFWKGVITSYV